MGMAILPVLRMPEAERRQTANVPYGALCPPSSFMKLVVFRVRGDPYCCSLAARDVFLYSVQCVCESCVMYACCMRYGWLVCCVAVACLL